MAKNRMSEIAEILSIELGKTFFVRVPEGWPVKAKLTKKGTYEEIHGAMSPCYRLLTELLTGKAEIMRDV